MHEQNQVEKELKEEATKLSAKYHGAPVVVIVGGHNEAKIPRTMTGSSIKGKNVRLRDLLGILQTSIQIESWKHFMKWE